MAFDVLKFIRYYYKPILLVITPLLLMPIALVDNYPVTRVIYVYAIMMVYWIFEVNLWGITGLIPIIAFPALGVMASSETTMCYFKERIAVFMAFVFVTIAMDNAGLHRRVSVSLLQLVGINARILLLLVLIITFIMSIFISNTALAAIMIPFLQNIVFVLEECGIGQVFLDPLENDPDAEKIGDPRYDEKKRPSKMTLAFFLGSGYIMSVGSIVQLGVSVTNRTFRKLHEQLFKYDKTGVHAASWQLLCIPMAMIMAVFIVIYCEVYFLGWLRPWSQDSKYVLLDPEKKAAATITIADSKKDLGKMSFHEIATLVMFLVAVVLIISQNPAYGGWMNMSKTPTRLSAIPVILILLCFAIPSQLTVFDFFNEEKRPKKIANGLITWKVLQLRMPWIMIFFMGGAFALTEGAHNTGFSALTYQVLYKFHNKSRMCMTFLSTAWVTFLTQFFMDNRTMIEIVMPALTDVTQAGRLHPDAIIAPAVVAITTAVFMPISSTALAQLTNPINVRFWIAMKAGLIPTIGLYLINVVYTVAVGNMVWVSDWNKFPNWAAMA